MSPSLAKLAETAVPGLRVAKLTGYGLEEITAPNANQQGGSEQDYRVKTGVIAASPIDTFLDIQPERKFIEGESGAHAVEQGHQATDQKR